MSKASKNGGSSRGVGMRGRGALGASEKPGPLADLVRDLHRQLDALHPPKRRGRSESAHASPSILAIIENILREERGDAGEAPQVQAK